VATASENLCKGYVMKPCLLTSVVYKGLISLRQKESRLVGKVCNLYIVL
jgi:hypothetical protein